MLFKLFSPQEILRGNQQPHSAISQLAVYPKVGRKVWFGTYALMPADCLSLPPSVFILSFQSHSNSLLEARTSMRPKLLLLTSAPCSEAFPASRSFYLSPLQVTTYYSLGKVSESVSLGLKCTDILCCGGIATSQIKKKKFPNLHTSLKAKYLRL